MVGSGLPKTVSENYSLKISMALVGVLLLTLAWLVLFTVYVVEGNPDELEDRAVAAMTGSMIIFTMHVGTIGIVLGGNAALRVRELGEVTGRIGAGDFDVDLETDRDDEFGQLYRAVDDMRRSLAETLNDLDAQRQRAQTAKMQAERQRNELLDAGEEFSSVVDACADGDFSTRFEPESDEAAIRAIADSYNELLDELSIVLDQSKSVAKIVDTASHDLQHSSAEIRQSSQRVSAGIQEISQGSQQQTKHLEAAALEVRQLSSATEEVASSTTTIASQSEELSKLSQSGREAADRAVGQIRTAAETSAAVVETMNELEEATEKIEAVVTFIEQVAKQTNMLAVNASIEAERERPNGGPNGGFTAVSDEVKALSKEIQDATSEINEILGTVEQGTHQSAEEITIVDEEITNTVRTIDQLNSLLETVSGNVQSVDMGIKEIDEATTDQATSASELATIIESVAQVSAETTSQAEEVAAASEEATATIEAVHASAEELDRYANRLAGTLSHFSGVSGSHPANPESAE